MPDQPLNFANETPSKSDLDILNAPDVPVKGKVEAPSKEGEEAPDDTDSSNEEGSEDTENPDASDSEEEGGEEGEEKPDEEGEDEDEAEEDEEESTEEVEGVDELSLYKQLKKADPEIFKKFPELRTTLFREQKYAELFPTIEDATEAHSKLENVDQLEKDLMAGNPDNLFSAIAETDKAAFASLAANLLPSLYKADKDSYNEVLKVPIKRAIQNVYLQAKKAGNTNLANAALYLDQFYFGEDGIGTDPKTTVGKKTEKSPEQQKWEKEKQEHEEKIQNDFRDQTLEVIQAKLNKEIATAIEKYEFDPYKRKNVSKDIASEVNKLLASDKRYQAGIGSLWNQARSARFAGDWKARITNAYLARAKAVLPLAKKKVIDEATGRVIKDKKLIKRLTPSNSSGVKPVKFDSSRIDKTKTTDADLLSDDPSRIKYKKG